MKPRTALVTILCYVVLPAFPASAMVVVGGCENVKGSPCSGCGEDSPGMPSVSDSGEDEGFKAIFPIGPTIPSILGPELTWQTDAPADGVTIASLSYAGCDSHQAGTHLQVKAGNSLVDVIQGDGQLDLIFYGPDPAIPSGPFQGQFVDVSGLAPTKAISYSFQDPALHVTLTANGQPRMFQLTYDAGTATRTWTDEAAGYKFSAAFAAASATERLVTTEELRAGVSGWQAVSRVQDTWRNRVPEPGAELYQLEERVIDPGGENLATSYRYLDGVVVRQLEPGGAWTVRSRMNFVERKLKLLVVDTQGELVEVEDSNFPAAYVDGIETVEYRGWLDAPMPGEVPCPANCVATVKKQEAVLIDGQWLWRNVTETWTAGYCSGKSDSVTKSDGQAVTRTWSSQGQYLVREDGPLGTTNEDGTIRRLAAEPGDYTPAGGFQQNTNGEYLQTIEWDDGPVRSQQPSSAVMEVRIEDPSGRLIERKLHPCLPNGNYDAQSSMLTETWTTPIEAPGEVWHFKNGILCGRSSADESASETFEQTAGGPEIRTQRDASGRVESIIEQYAVPVVTTYTFDGRKEIVTRSAGGLSEVSITERDVAGRIIAITDKHGITSTISYPNSGRTVTTVRPGGVTEVAMSYIDGQRKSLTGSGVVPVFWAHAVDADGFLATTEYVGTGGTSPRFTTTRTDWRGRTVATIRPNPAGTGTVTESREYSPTTGHLTKIAHTLTGTGTRIAADRLFAHDPLGRVNRSGLDLGAVPDGVLTDASPDRLTTTLREYVNTDGRWWDQTATRALRIANDANAAYETIVRTATAPLNENGAACWTTVAILPGGLTRATERVESLAGGTVEVRTDSNATTAAPDQTQVYVGDRMVSSSEFGAAQASVFAHDALGRQTLATDPRGGVTRTIHDTAGRITQWIDHSGNTTTVDYYPPGGLSAGLVRRVTNPEGEVTRYIHDSLGRVQEVTGNGTYRRSFTYNMYGDLWTLTTYAAGSGQTTTWNRFPASGLVHEKVYPGGCKRACTYHADGQVATRTWARLAGGQPLVTTYHYHPSGELWKILYSDSDSTPDVEILVDRLGRPASVTDGGGTTGIVYLSEAPLLSAENYPAGHAWLPNVSILQGWDPARRQKGVEAAGGAGAVTWVGGEKVFDAMAHHEYDQVTGQLAGVARHGGTLAHHYQYAPGTDLIKDVVHQNQGPSQTIATEFRRHDGAGRLYAIVTRNAAGTTLQRHSYRHDSAGRRTRASREDGAYWAYGYNERGEVTAGKKHLPDGTPLAGHQFEYAFDGLGNRVSAKSGGDQTGHGLRSITYTPNALNQYEEIDTPGSFDVIGRAPAGEVTVNSAPALRQGARFRAEVSADNSARSVWQQVTVSNGQGPDVVGRHYLPKQAVHPLHDDDGNLIFDGRWDYVWDAENRLVSMTTNLDAQALGEPFRKLVFDYDWLGRRLRKRVFDSPSATDPVEDFRFAYDGWNLVAEYTASGSTLTLLRSYVWGADLSGTPQGAGGVGGLLSARAGGAEYAASYDGNGNIVGWIDAGGNLACRQEYDPFGSLIAREGSVEIPVGFSTKYRDEETGLIYYGYRYYDPVTGRWPSRDPIEEAGGLNLYGFVENDPSSLIDPRGLWPIMPTFLGDAPFGKLGDVFYVRLPVEATPDLVNEGAISWERLSFVTEVKLCDHSGDSDCSQVRWDNRSPRAIVRIRIRDTRNELSKWHEWQHAEQMYQSFAEGKELVEKHIGICMRTVRARCYNTITPFIRQWLLTSAEFRAADFHCRHPRSGYGGIDRQSECKKSLLLKLHADDQRGQIDLMFTGCKDLPE